MTEPELEPVPRLEPYKFWLVSSLVFNLWTNRNNQPTADLRSYICAGTMLTAFLSCILLQIIVKWAVLDRRIPLARKRMGIRLFTLLDRSSMLIWGVSLVIFLYLSLASKDWTRAWILAGVGAFFSVLYVLMRLEERRNQRKLPNA